MLDEIQAAIVDYQDKWQAFCSQRSDKAFFAGLKPVAIGWKVADRAEYEKRYAELHDECHKVIETWMNGRWVAKMLLKGSHLPGGIQIVKLMQRRPGSSDATGLDHMDFYSPEVSQAENVLEQEVNLKWTRESNEVIDNYEWLSVWFAGTEAKLKASTVIDIVVHELQSINREIMHQEGTKNGSN
jgi:hypothetical protein